MEDLGIEEIKEAFKKRSRLRHESLGERLFLPRFE